MVDQAVATAFVDIRPNLVGFEAELSAGLSGALRGIAPTTSGLTRGATAQTALGTATKRTTTALAEQTAVLRGETTQLALFSRGAAATGLSLFGLRGATLAATSQFLAGAAAITALAKAVQTATSFNSQLAVFGATTGATADQLARVSDAAKALGRDITLPGVSAADAATAMTELAKAGLSVEDAIAGARGVLQLATAANIDFSQATELAASAINAFALSGDRAGVVADTLANAANAAQGSIVDIGIAFQQAAAIGHQVGLSFQDTTLFITELARAGLTGSDAGTSLRTALIRLINPTVKAQKVFKDLGIEVRDAQGNLRPEFFTNLGLALQKMSRSQRDATLALIGGQDAVRALAILSRGSAQDIIRLRDELAKQGTAAEVAKARLTGLAGAAANLSNTIESFALSLGQKATPSLIAATNAITGFITAAAQSPAIGLLGETIHTTADAVGALAGALGAVAPVLGTFIGLAANIASAVGPGVILASVAGFLVFQKALSASTLALRLFLAELSTSIALGGGLRAATALMTESLVGFATSATGVGLALTAATAGLIFLITRESSAEKATKALKKATDDLASSLAAQATATEDLARAQSAVKTDEIALQAQKLAVVQARNALTNSDAAKGSFERAQLENRLAFALDTVRLAEQQLATDRKAAAEAQKTFAQANKNTIADLATEAGRLRDVAKETTNLANARALAKFGNAQTGEAEATRNIIAAINERAAAERKANTESSRAVAERLEALSRLAAKVNDLPTTISLLFNAKDLQTGLQQVEANLRATGQRGAAEFTHALLLGTNPEILLGPMRAFFAEITKLAGGGGADAGNAFSNAFQNIVVASLAAINRLIVQGATRLTVQLSNQTDTLLQNVQRVELSGGSPQAQLAAARTARARAERELAAADAAVKASGGRSAAAKQRQAKALQDVASAQGDIDRAESEIAANAQKAAATRQQKIQTAQAAKDKADRAFLDLLSGERGAFDLRFAIAQGTKTLSDDISAQQAFTGELTREIAAIRRSALSEADKAAAIEQLRVERQRSINATKDLVAQQNEAAKQAIIDRRDRQQESLELDVQIAETGKNQAKERKAHQALLNFLIERRKHTSRGSLEWKRLTLEIERERAAIAETKKSTTARTDALKSLEFSFLQTQTGFVANLLGNLLPTGSVAGTLGGGAISTAAPTVPSASFGTAVHQRPPDVPAAAFATAVHQRGKIDKGFQAASQTGATAGASFGQLSVLITIAREQLAVLRAATGQKAHPEANVQRTTQNASMDILPYGV